MGSTCRADESRMLDDTAIGGLSHRFPTTQRSAIDAVRIGDQADRDRALGIIVETYWKPVYKYIRVKWKKSNEDAKDLTQGFFARSLEKDFFQAYDQTRARFRTFIRTCLDAYLANEHKAAQRVKRGGEALVLSLDFETAEGELSLAELPAGGDMEDYFEKEFARSLFSLTVETLRAECEADGKLIHFQLFERYDLDSSRDDAKLTYEQLAGEFGLTVSAVTNHLSAVRRRFRRIVLDKLRELTATDDEFRREARSLLGVNPG